jgi:hypothetical protein
MYLKRFAVKAVEVRIHTLPWGEGWPVWFYNDIMDLEDKAPMSDQLKSEAYELKDYISKNSTWDEISNQFRWNVENNRREFNRMFDSYVHKLQTELGAGYRVIAEYSRKNKNNYVQLSYKKCSPTDLLRQYLANR